MSSDLPPHALAAGTQIRDYTIVSVIGTGGFSIVYKAIDNSLQREVAIKEYFPTAMASRAGDGTIAPHSRDAGTFSKGIESFLNEGKLLAAFDHPALVRVYRCWEERGTAYLAMRLYAGTTLRDRRRRGKCLRVDPPAKSRDTARQQTQVLMVGTCPEARVQNATLQDLTPLCAGKPLTPHLPNEHYAAAYARHPHYPRYPQATCHAQRPHHAP